MAADNTTPTADVPWYMHFVPKNWQAVLMWAVMTAVGALVAHFGGTTSDPTPPPPIVFEQDGPVVGAAE